MLQSFSVSDIMFFSNNINKNWKELAEVRSRTTDTKVRARVSRYQSPETLEDKSGPSLLFDEEDNGFAHYENGDLAVVSTNPFHHHTITSLTKSTTTGRHQSEFDIEEILFLRTKK